jgi:hypothetical protein
MRNKKVIGPITNEKTRTLKKLVLQGIKKGLTFL